MTSLMQKLTFHLSRLVVTKRPEPSPCQQESSGGSLRLARFIMRPTFGHIWGGLSLRRRVLKRGAYLQPRRHS